MDNNKTSIVLSAIDKFSRPVNTAVKSVGKLQSKVAETSSTLSELNKKQQLVARFKGLESRAENTRAALSKARTEVARLKNSEAQASDIVRRHTRSLKLAEQAVLEAAHSYGAESEQVAAARREVTRLTKAKRQAEQAYKREKSALKTAEQASSRLTTEYGQQSQKLGSLRNDLTSAGLKLNSLGAEQLRLARQTDKANQALAQQEAKLKRIQSLNGRIAERNAQKGELVGQAMETAAMVAPMVLAGKRAVEYESTFADVKKVVNFKDEKEEAEYRTKMMKLAGDLGMRQEGIAQIVTAAGQSGIEKTKLLKFAESATKMSVAWDVSAEEAGSTLATWRAAMGLTQENALDLADSTNYLSNNMNAKAKDIAAVMVRQGSTAMGAGLNYNQTAALSASFIAGGATEEVAATALKNITGRLTAGYAATNGQKEAMGKLGFNADELASMMQEDAQGTLVQVMRQLQDVDAAERGAVISQLFGEEVKGAVAKLVTTLDDDKSGLIAAFGRVEKQADRAGSVNDEYANRAKTRSHTLSQLSAKFDRMMVVLGDRLLPVIDAVVPPLMTVVDGISDFAEANPKLASGLLAVAGAIAVVKAGAIAFKLARLTMGNGLDRLRLGREQLSGVTNNTALNARKATNELSRFNQELNSVSSRRGRSGGYESNRRRRGRSSGRRSGRLVGGITDLFGGASLQAQSLAGKDYYRQARRARGGKWGRMAALLGGGTALSVMSANANAGELAMTGAAVAGTAGDLFNALPIGGALLGGAGKLFRPLDIALSGAALTSAIANGDGKQIGGTAGDMIGGLGGAAAGAMAGAAIGSVVPVIGTAVGGVIGSVVGGIGGGELGQWLGENIGGWFSEDKTDKPAPASVAEQSKQLVNSNRQISFAPVIQIQPSGNPEYDKGVANQLLERMKAELVPVMFGGSDVGVRSDASLSDRRDT
ncbi:phage tail tape measure protein [Pseudoalteromonas sp. SCSIO 43201]|uniref:phage tail tape measure protein n=1 Tax=Pseudoalteromonas sp. SCSIO 43201 TaxID=2822842 RepID=UPI002076354F|nr:phage tail tape measure protein [Pseudoalteromonas sp. SCSIO 43201]USD30867.1 phage tail tape measure protein [Pseudoalteromonas sp. SCSIO 43201]